MKSHTKTSAFRLKKESNKKVHGGGDHPGPSGPQINGKITLSFKTS